MAGGNYNKFRKTNNYPYKKGTWNKGGSVSKRSSGNIKAAFEQRDQCEVVLNCNNVINCNFGTRNDKETFTVAALNVFDALLHSEFFNNYAPMYDQVRVDKVKAKVTSLSYPNKKDQEIQSNISVVTAFDRNGLDTSQLTGVQDGAVENDLGHKIVGTKIGKAVSTYSSALTKNLSFGSTFEVVRYITPFTIQEKSQYIATDSLKYWYDNYNHRENKFDLGKNNTADYEAACISSNPCYLERDPSIPFKPTYLVGVIGLDELSGDCIFNVEMDVCCTFRGLRKSQSM